MQQCETGAENKWNYIIEANLSVKRLQEQVTGLDLNQLLNPNISKPEVGSEPFLGGGGGGGGGEWEGSGLLT